MIPTLTSSIRQNQQTSTLLILMPTLTGTGRNFVRNSRFGTYIPAIWPGQAHICHINNIVIIKDISVKQTFFTVLSRSFPILSLYKMRHYALQNSSSRLIRMSCICKKGSLRAVPRDVTTLFVSHCVLFRTGQGEWDQLQLVACWLR